MDNSGDGLIKIPREEAHRSLPLTPWMDNPGATLTPASATLSTSPTDNSGDGLKERGDLSDHTRARKRNQISPLATSPTDNCGDVPSQPTGQVRGEDKQQPTPLVTSPTDNPRDARHQSSVHFRLHGPGFLDISLVPPPCPDHFQGEDRDLTGKEGHNAIKERKIKLSESTPPPTTTRQTSERITVIQSPGRWSARPSTDRDHPERIDAQDPTMATPGINIKALENLQADELIKLI